jgi:hypothetical protein
LLIKHKNTRSARDPILQDSELENVATLHKRSKAN